MAASGARVKRAGLRGTSRPRKDTGNDLLRRFASREVVMSITGHSTPAMHSRYSRVDAGEKAAAVGKVIELVTEKAKSTSKTSQRSLERGLLEAPAEEAAATG